MMWLFACLLVIIDLFAPGWCGVLFWGAIATSSIFSRPLLQENQP